jgi:hypothetical protein
MAKPVGERVLDTVKKPVGYDDENRQRREKNQHDCQLGDVPVDELRIKSVRPGNDTSANYLDHLPESVRQKLTEDPFGAPLGLGGGTQRLRHFTFQCMHLRQKARRFEDQRTAMNLMAAKPRLYIGHNLSSHKFD